MKKLLGFLIVFILSTAVYTVVAQEANEEPNTNALREAVDKSTYGKNWFISFGGSANLLTAESDGDIAAEKRIKYGGAFTFGKWFNPYFGARIQVMGGALRGFNYVANHGGYYVWDNYHHYGIPMGCNRDGQPAGMVWDFSYLPPTFPTSDPATGEPNPVRFQLVPGKGEWGFWQDFNYATATVDLMANFTNLMRGYYKDHSFFEFIPFMGLGEIHAFSNHTTTPRFDFFVVKIGFRLNFNFSNTFAFYVEPQGNATSKEFDGYAGDNMGDGVVNLSAGFQFTFNRGFDNSLARLTANEIDKLNKKVNDNRYMLENHQDILERQQDLLDRLEKCCDENQRAAVNAKEVVTTVVENVGLPEYVRFGLNSYSIDPTEQRKIVEVVNYLKKSSDSKILVVGYADRNTGNPRYNLDLSQKREEQVAEELRRLGISDDRIAVEWKGDKEQPFLQNDWNRVVILVERK